MPFIKPPKSQTEVVALCVSMTGCEGRSHLSQSTVSTRQPLSISVCKAVLVSIQCFCIYRGGANVRLLSLRIRATGVAAGCPPTFTQSRDASKAEIWERATQERGEFYRSISIFTKTEPNQTFSYKASKQASICMLYVLFWLAACYSYSPNCYRI